MTPQRNERRETPAARPTWETPPGYLQAGAPSVVAGAKTPWFTKIAHVTVEMFAFVSLALQPPAERVGPPNVLPWVVQKFTEPAVGGVVHAMLAEYFTESAKYASSAVTRLRRSDFMEAMYAFALVFANFGIAIAAKMPMITTTIRSSMSVKPLRFIQTPGEMKTTHTTLLAVGWQLTYRSQPARGTSLRPSGASDRDRPSGRA